MLLSLLLPVLLLSLTIAACCPQPFCLLQIAASDFPAPPSSCHPPQFLERALLPRAWDDPTAPAEMLCLAQLAALHCWGSIQALPQRIQHLIPAPRICSVATKHFDTSFQIPGYEHCCEKGIFYHLLHPFNRELSTHWPFKKFNNFLIIFVWSFSMGQNYRFAHPVSSMLTH